MKQPHELAKGQNVVVDPELKSLRMSVRWAVASGGGDVDLVALLLGSDQRVRSDADMVFYNQPGTANGSVVLAGKVLGDGRGSDAVSVDLATLGNDVHGLTIAASSDGTQFGEITEVEWCVLTETGEPVASYRVEGLTTERALVLGELYRRGGAWRLRAVGQGWEGGLAGLAHDYGVGVTTDDSVSEGDSTEEFDVTEPSDAALATEVGTIDADLETAPPPEAGNGVHSPAGSDDGMGGSDPQSAGTQPPVIPAAPRVSAKVRITAAKSASIPVPKLADDASWQPSRLFSISGIGGTDEQEKRATSALLWTMSAVRPLGRALTARATAPAGPAETFLEVGFPLGEQRVIPDGVIRIARAGRVWTGLVEVKTGDAVLHREQLENYLRLASRRKYDVVMTISNEISTDPGIHPVTVSASLLDKVTLVHLSWSEVMHEVRMLLAHHPFTDPLPLWILAELLKYLEHPRSGTMAFTDMGATWVPVRDAVAAGTLRSTDRVTQPVVLSWHRLIRQLGLGLTARLGVPVKQSLPRRVLSDPELRNHEAAQRLADHGVLTATLKVPDAAGPITISADLRTAQIRTSIDVQAPQEGTLPRRVSWLSKQLKDAPDSLIIEARFDPRPETTCEKLADIREKPASLIPGKEWEPTSFTISQVHPMGTKRSGAHGSLVSTVTKALDTFYAQVVESIRPWTPPAPQLPPIANSSGSAQSASTLEEASTAT